MRAMLFAGRVHPTLAREVAEWVQVPLGSAEISSFPDGEIRVQVHDDVEGAHVAVLQPTTSPEAILELLLLADALQRDRPRSLTLLLPYYGYARQDRRTGRGPVSAAVMARVLSLSADALVTVDLHAPETIADFISRPHLHLSPAYLFANCLRRHVPRGGQVAVVSADAGSSTRADRLGQVLRHGRPVVVLQKRRWSPQRCRVVGLEPPMDLAGRWAVLVDDIVSTGETLLQAARWLADHGAGPIWACVTHLLGSPGFVQAPDAPIDRLLVTDSLPMTEEACGPRVQVVSLAPLLGAAVRRLWLDRFAGPHGERHRSGQTP